MAYKKRRFCDNVDRDVLNSVESTLYLHDANQNNAVLFGEGSNQLKLVAPSSTGTSVVTLPSSTGTIVDDRSSQTIKNKTIEDSCFFVSKFDNTKKLFFNCASIPTSTIITLALPPWSGTIQTTGPGSGLARYNGVLTHSLSGTWVGPLQFNTTVYDSSPSSLMTAYINSASLAHWTIVASNSYTVSFGGYFNYAGFVFSVTLNGTNPNASGNAVFMATVPSVGYHHWSCVLNLTGGDVLYLYAYQSSGASQTWGGTNLADQLWMSVLGNLIN